MNHNEHDNGIPGSPPKPAFFDPREAMLNTKDTVTVLGHMGPEDAIEAERLADEKVAGCDEDQQNGPGK